MTRAVLYLRISDDRPGLGLGVKRQEEDGRALCKRRRWTVAEVIVDNDVSAYSGKRRKGYERLLDGLRAGSWDAVVAYHPDRLHRSPKELEGFIDIVEASGCQVATVTAGDIDLSTPTGRAVARTIGAWARHSSEQAAERIRRKHQQLAEDGQPAGGGTRPFGYRIDRLHLEPKEAALVRAAARDVLDGATLRSVAVDWQARGVPSVTGRPWSTTVVRRILTAPRSAGFRERAGKLHKGTWTPLLDEVTWRRLKAILLDPTRRTNHAPRTYLLTGGLARCGLCTRPLIARPRGDGTRCYVCASGPGFHGCGKIRVVAEAFEQDVRDRVAARVGRLPDAAPPPPVTGLLVEIEGAEAAMAELADDYYVHRSTTKAQFQAASASLTDRLDSLRSTAALRERSTRAPVDAEAVAVLAEPEPSQRQRATIEALVASVTVSSAVRGRNTYAPERVSVEWR